MNLTSLWRACSRGPLAILLMLALVFGASASARADVSLGSTTVNQSPQQSVTVYINTSTSSMYGGYYYAAFYNTDGEVIGGVEAAPYGPNIGITFGPFCPVAQKSRNIARIEVFNGTPQFNMTLNDLSVDTGSPDADLNHAGTTPGEASEVSQGSTVDGSLIKMNDNVDRYQYYKVFLDAQQKLVVNGWARSSSPQYGASLFAEITRDPNDEGAGLMGVAPYGTASFDGAFVNQGAPGEFYIKVHCDAWKVCKYEMHVSLIDLRPKTGCPDGTCGGGNAGPASSYPVQLSNGREESRFTSDLTVYNPVGPSVEWKRQWNETSSLQLTSSPGFSPGWTHNYDFWLNSCGHYNLQFHFPNGMVDELTRKNDATGTPTNELTVPVGSSYFVRGLAGVDSHNDPTSKCDWQWIEVVWSDSTVWRFEPKEDFTMRLVRVTDSTGHALKFEYDGPDGESKAISQSFAAMAADPNSLENYTSLLTSVFHSISPSKQYRLKTIKNDKGTALLSLDYRTTDGRLISATDAYGRMVSYGWIVPTGLPYTCLSGVSQIKTTTQTTNPIQDGYTYAKFGAAPVLKTITRPHPNGNATTVTAENFYDSTGRVTATQDANGNTRSYTYNAYPLSTQTQVEVRDSTNALVGQWNKFMDAQGRETGTSDASGHHSYMYYEDPANPDKVTRVRDPLGREATVQYDVFGNAVRTVSPRGVVTLSTYDYGAWRFGRLMSVQSQSPTVTLPATTFTYYEPSGLVATVTGFHPNGGGTITASYTYDNYGNVLTATEPGTGTAPGAVVFRTTTFSYTLDGVIDFPMRAGRPVAVQDPLGHVTHLRYDARGNLANASDALGDTTLYAYDLDDQVTRTELPATGQSGPYRGEVRYAYAYRGGPLLRTQVYDENRNVYRTTTTHYGAEGEVLGTVGDHKSQSVTYDALYRQVAFRDGGNHQTFYSYDQDGHPSEIRYPLANSATGRDIERFTSYDASGALLQQVDGRGVVTNFTYNDPEGELTDISYPASTGENVALSYDSLGRSVSRTDGVGVESVAYNAVGEVDHVTTTYHKRDNTALPSWTQSFVYNADGSRASLTTPLGATNYGYDNAGRWTGLSDWAGATSSWSYLDNDWLSSSTSPLGVQTHYAYNALGQLLSQSDSGSANVGGGSGSANEVLAQWGDPTQVANRLFYNAAGQMKKAISATTSRYDMGGTTQFESDFRGQISQEVSTRGAGYTQNYGFDTAGNPTLWRGGVRTFNADNQETTTSASGLGFAYDGQGNATRWLHRDLVSTPPTGGTGPSTVSEVEKGLALSYDAQGQMAQVNAVNSDGSMGDLVQKNGFRSDGLRAWKENADGVRTYYFYDGEQLLGAVSEEADGTLHPPSQMMWGADGLIGQRWRDENNVERAHYYLWDTQGNLALSYSESGALSGGSAYTAWGTPVPKSDGSLSEVSFGYGGKYGYLRDSETGLILCTHRFYDPSTGTWTQRDPLSYDGGQNLYAYVEGDPVNSTDPNGLEPTPMPLPTPPPSRTPVARGPGLSVYGNDQNPDVSWAAGAYPL